MTIFKTSVGIQIGSKDLRFAVVRNVAGKLRLVSTFEAKGVLDLPLDERKEAVSKLIAERKLPLGGVFLSLPRESGIVRQLDFPAEVLDKLRSAISFQIDSLSPWPADEVYWDFAHEPVKKNARTFQATVVIVPREILDPWIEFFRSIGLTLTGASLAPLYCAHGISVLWPLSSPTLVLDCEDGYVEGCLVQDGRLSSITQAGEDLIASMRSAVERLTALGRLPSMESVRLLVCGPRAADAGPVEQVALAIDGSGRDASRGFSVIATALASLRGAGFNANLIPETLRFRRNHVQWIPAYALVALTALLGAAFLLREPYQMVIYGSEIGKEIERVAPEANKVAAQQTELSSLIERYRALSGTLRQNDFALETMRELARALPQTAWITNYNYQGATVTISGAAESASEIQSVLEANPLFKEVQFTGSVVKDAKGKDRFTLKAVVEVAQ